jgi:hypothetical protein|tara:strand:- start:931 stop:2397 length:1467 start_codon:yes stop_codon:yes gene_type:complete
MGLDASNAPGLLPHQKRVTLSSNYLSFDSSTGGGTFAQQYLPELYEAEVERFGNRTLSGFLRMVGAEMPMTSDQVIWSEQNRLHISYDGCTNNGAGTILTVPVEDDKECVIRIGSTVVISNGLKTVKARVHNVGAATGSGNARVANVHYRTYAVNDGSAIDTTAGACKIFVYGSEFAKGTPGMETFNTSAHSTQAIQPDFKQFDNKPIILKDFYEVSGSDAAQIGWVEVATEDGTSGYLWYLKAESETRLRFEDYLEMSMVEAEKKGTSTSGVTVDGSEGLFAAIEDRGNIYNDFAGAQGAGTGALGDFDDILKQLDKQGAIEENMLFLSRATALDFDDMIATMNGGFAGSAGARGASYGLFNNEAEMALNFGFDGFRRGSYDFYKTDWKYLNDASTRGLTADVDGVMIPAGTSTVYDQMLGQNIRRPFLHVRYRASEADDRKMKSWVVGSVGGAYTSGLDAMQVHFLSERCLCVQGANNFVLFKSTV